MAFAQVDFGLKLASSWVDVDVDLGLTGIVFSSVRKVDVDVGGFVLLGSAVLLANVNFFSSARTVVTILLTSYMNLFLHKLVVAGRKIGRDGETFPSDALLSLWKVDFTLDMGAGGLVDLCVAPVRRREDAEGNGNSGVKVQIDDSSAQENTSRMPFDVPKGRQEGVSCFFLVKEGEGRRRRETLLDSISFSCRRRKS